MLFRSKIVRLQSGDDIIANYTEDENSGLVHLEKPMAIFFKRLPTGRAVMMMSPWLPLELVENNYADLYSQDILTIIEPKKSLVEYYQNAMDDVQQLIEEAKDENGEDTLFEESDDADDEEEEIVERLTGIVKELKIGRAHV